MPMKRNLLILLWVLIGVSIKVEAVENTSVDDLRIGERYKKCIVGESVERIAWDDEIPQQYTFVTKSSPKAIDEELVSLSVQTTKEGELETVIGDKLLDIESLTVSGPVNDDDFTIMWRASFYGNLQYIDLKDALLSNGGVPRRAFYHDEQQESSTIYPVKLKKIILPDNATSIGEYAFCFAVYLESINIPQSLRVIGRCSFNYCYALNFDVLTLPEGMESIEFSVFAYCTSLTAKVELPSTIKKIGRAAFMGSKIATINLPDGLQSLGSGAFYGSGLKEIYVPDGCIFEGEDHFGECHELKTAHIPEGMTVMPSGMFNGCYELEDVNIPESVTEMQSYAFSFCDALSHLRLPRYLKKTSFYSLFYLSDLEEIYFPATMEVIGEQSCKYWRNIKRIYCAAPIPPLCIGEEKEPLQTPFGVPTFGPELQTPRDTPVYVPRGSADAYRNAWGWNYFTNFIETDDFPGSAVDEILSDEDSGELPMYDLYGKKVVNPQRGEIYIKGGKKFIQN